MADNKTPGMDEDADGQNRPVSQDTQPATDGPVHDPDETTDDSTTESERVIIEKEKIIETRSGFGSALFGGIVAASIGFILARADFIEPYLPEVLKSSDMSEEIAQLQTDLTSQTAAVADINNKVDGIDIPDLTPLETRIEDVAAGLPPMTADIETLRAELSAIEKRLTTVEKRPIDEGVSEAAIAAYERELAALQDAMAKQRSEVESLIAEARAMKAEAGELEANAAAAAQQAANRATMAKLRTELDAGAPFAAEVQELADAGVEVPADLSGVAADGVATLTALNNSFPPAARAALAAAREASAAEDRGLQSFLQRQLGARSVEPRDGDDPDAVLSRAEAAVADGRIQEALEEISKLPEPAQAAMSDWTDRAQTRLSAATAADALANRLNTN